MTGKLYIVATPIGNLGDLTLRAIETLRKVDRVFAEDTRRTRALLSHLEIHGKPLHRVDAHAEVEKLDELIAYIEAGDQVALVSDAGMPLVSDPGFDLVRSLAARGLGLEVIPGPSAVSAAVALSGLVSGAFLFLGFLPRHGEKRERALERILRSPDPVVLFEAANRAPDTLAELAARAPERPAVICRELTKLHEQAHRGTLAELARLDGLRGELTIVIGEPGSPVDELPAPAATPSDDQIAERIRAAVADGAPTKVIAKELSDWSGLPRRELYTRIQKLRDSEPQS